MYFINNTESQIGLFKAGVSKGHMLVRLFADDISLFYSSTNLLQIDRKVNSDMNLLNTWLVKLTPHIPKKKECILFSNNKNIDQVNIRFNGENIKEVDYHT